MKTLKQRKRFFAQPYSRHKVEAYKNNIIPALHIIDDFILSKNDYSNILFQWSNLLILGRYSKNSIATSHKDGVEEGSKFKV